MTQIDDKAVVKKLVDNDKRDVANLIAEASYSNILNTSSNFLNTAFNNLGGIYLFVLRIIGSCQSRRFFEHLFNFEAELKKLVVDRESAYYADDRGTTRPALLLLKACSLLLFVVEIASDCRTLTDLEQAKLNKQVTFLMKLKMQLSVYDETLKDIYKEEKDEDKK